MTKHARSSAEKLHALVLADCKAMNTRGEHRETEFRIPVSAAGIPREWNRYGKIWELEWECGLLYGNVGELQLTTVARFPHDTTVSVMNHDIKSV